MPTCVLPKPLAAVLLRHWPLPSRGAITGMLVVGLGLLGVAGYYAILRMGAGADPDLHHVIEPLVGLAFGSSLISIFARLGGGIFTKGPTSARPGGQGGSRHPEDDPRNPAVIADNVATTWATAPAWLPTSSRTYAVTVVATMVLAALTIKSAPGLGENLILYPLALGGVSIIASIVGCIFVKVA